MPTASAPHLASPAAERFPLGQKRPPIGRGRAAFHGVLHFLAYHFLMTLPFALPSRMLGLKLRVPPTVFHPKLFPAGPFFAKFLLTQDLHGQRAVDVGTGSGILALAALKAGAAHALALDINPAAVGAATDNAARNGLGSRLSAAGSNLLSAIAPRPLFDLVIASPPSFEGEPRDVADRAWFAGPGYRDIAELFAQTAERLRPGGRMLLCLSSDSDLERIGILAERAGFSARLVCEQRFLAEWMLIYELRWAGEPPRAG